jgi:16S rRNA processing protein RimM
VPEIILGTLVKPIGLKGALKLRQSADFWEGALTSRRLQLVLPEQRRPVQVVASQDLGRGMRRTSFAGIADRDASEALVGAELMLALPDPDIEAPPELRPFQVLGFTVFLRDGTQLGTVSELLPMPAQDVFVVQGDSREYMIPNTPAIVLAVDLDKQTVQVDPPDGLLDL